MNTIRPPDLTGTGTPEECWHRWFELGGLPEQAGWRWTNRPRGADVVVVSPHPDDEVLGVGGTLQSLAAAGADITLVAVTDGESSHPGSATLSPADLAERRPREVRDALVLLGLEHVRIERLGLPDGGIAAHETEVADVLSRILHPGALCLATWHRDGHPDHDAVGRAARVAASACGTALLEYPLWLWHWARPGDPAVPWPTLRRLRLPERAVARKRAAAMVFSTQVEPLSAAPEDAAVLPPPVLRRWLRDFEVFVT